MSQILSVTPIFKSRHGPSLHVGYTSSLHANAASMNCEKCYRMKTNIVC